MRVEEVVVVPLPKLRCGKAPKRRYCSVICHLNRYVLFVIVRAHCQMDAVVGAPFGTPLSPLRMLKMSPKESQGLMQVTTLLPVNKVLKQ